MSGRPVCGSGFRFSPFSLAACLAFGLCEAPALAQSTADAPSVPAEPAPAPPASEPPAAAASEPTPAPPSPEAAPTAGPEAAQVFPPEGAAPPPEPSANAAFAPLPVAGAEAAQPPAASPPPANTAPAKPISHAAYNGSKDDDDSSGLLGPFRIGVLVGTGLPEVLSFGAELKITRFFGAGVNVGLIPTVRLKYYGEAAQKYQEYDVYGHIYPFGGSFFLGTGVGYAQVDGTLVNHFQAGGVTVDVTSDATVRTLVVTPQLGFLKIFPVGFAVGFALGAQIPIAPSQVEFNTVTVGIPPQFAEMIQRDYISPNDEKVRHTLDTLGRTPLPTFSLKIGWFL